MPAGAARARLSDMRTTHEEPDDASRRLTMQLDAVLAADPGPRGLDPVLDALQRQTLDPEDWTDADPDPSNGCLQP